MSQTNPSTPPLLASYHTKDVTLHTNGHSHTCPRNRSVRNRRRIIMAAGGVLLLLLVVGVAVGMTKAFLVGEDDKPLKVAAFNIRHFGRTKMSDNTVANHITQILNRYDVVLIQEVRDSTHTSLDDLWSRLNKTDHWGLVESDKIGRTTYKEQYVFYYKTGRARFLGSYQTPDSSDVYEREPFSAEFEYYSVTPGSSKRVALMALHSRPLDAVKELQALPASIHSAARHFSHAGGVVAMGDFNADCSYVSKTAMSTLDIFKSDSEFTSLIPHSADTTSGSSDCAYDRIIVYGSDVRARDASVYNFQSGLGLSTEATGDVSDHYPVEFQLH